MADKEIEGRVQLTCANFTTPHFKCYIERPDRPVHIARDGRAFLLEGGHDPYDLYSGGLLESH